MLLIYDFLKARTLGKEIKNMKVGNEGKEESYVSREDYTPSGSEDSQEMHSDMDIEATPQHKKEKKKIKMEKKVKRRILILDRVSRFSLIETTMRGRRA